MSGFGISPTDIVNGVKLCCWIYHHCFEEVDRADTKYIQFGNSIKGLEENLGRLKQQIESQAPYHLPNSDGFITDDTEGCGSINDLIDVVGDYELTLRECQSFLRNHRDFERRNDFIKNVHWGLSIQQKVDALNARVQAHNGKLQLLLEPFRFQQLGRIEDMIALLTDRLAPPPPLEEARIPAYAVARFEETLSRELNARGKTINTLSRSEALDALYKHWQRSKPGQQEDFGEYLSLLKCAWLIMRIEEAKPFKTARSGLPYRTSVLEIRRHVVARYSKDELVEAFGADLERLGPHAFCLLDDMQHQLELPLDEYSLEEKLLEIKLPDEPLIKQNLKIYRIGPTQIRLVRERTREATNTVLLESDSINIESDRLVPFYAVPGPRSTLSLEIHNGNGAAKRAYLFRSLQDVLQVQRAFTNYAVMSDMTDVDWNFREPGLMRRNRDGKCRVQIWHWLPLQSESRSNRMSMLTGTLSDRASFQSGGSGSSLSTLARVMSGVDPSLLESSFASVIGDGDGKSTSIVTAASPHHPSLVLYTKIEDTYAYLHTEMTPDLHLDPSMCYCRKEPDGCRRVVLSTGTRSTFDLRKLATADGNMGPSLDEWNVSTFGRASTYGMERNRAFFSKQVKVVKASWLSLDFDTVEARKKFQSHFEFVAKMRNEQMESIDLFKKHMRYLSHKPEKGDMSSSPPMRARSTFASNASQDTIRPPDSARNVGQINARLPDLPSFRPMTFDGVAGRELSGN